MSLTNFPEMWLDRVIQNLDSSDQATFLDGIPELGVDITPINEGSATEMNKIYVAETDFEVDVLVNNSAYPIPVQVYTDGTIEITLDKYQTKVISLTDDQTFGASYDKIDTATRSGTRGISTEKYKRAIHSIAPNANTADTPVIQCTGGDDNGRKKMTYNDFVALKRACDNAGVDPMNRRLVLCSDHWNDMLEDRERFADKLVNTPKGQVAKNIAGFEITQYIAMPTYKTDGTLQTYGAVPEVGDQPASVVFVKTAIAKKTGNTKQYFADSKHDPENQVNKLAYRHYFVAVPFQNKHIAAIRS